MAAPERLLATPRILALDLGTTFGYAYCPEGDTYREENLKVGSKRLATDSEVSGWRKTRMTRRQDPRIIRFYAWLNQFLLSQVVDIVVFEDVEFSTYTYQTQLWSSLRAAVWLFCHENNLYVECLPVPSLKQFAGSGSFGKSQMARAAASGRFSPYPKGGMLDRQTNALLDDNAVDALHLWKWAFQNLRRIPMTH